VLLRPLQDRVLIRRLEQDPVSSAGIFIPDTAQDKPAKGEVLAVGPGLRDREGKLNAPNVAIGDLVLFARWSGAEVEVAGETLLIIPEADILCRIERESASAETVTNTPERYSST